MLIDSHAHLNFRAFDQDLNQVIKRCQDRGMKVINVGSQLSSSQKAVEIARQFDGFFAAVGIHPIHLGKNEHDELEAKEQAEITTLGLEKLFAEVSVLAREEKVVAIGETGLDYFRLTGDAEASKKIQQEYFLRHLALAQELNKPVILHCRGEASNPLGPYDELFELIKNSSAHGVLHCFGADWPTAQKFLDAGWLLGITGIVTFGKKAEALQEVVRRAPLDKMLIETDAPYLAPEPHRGERNEPIYVAQVASKIAELKRLDADEVVAATAKNAEKLFGI